MAFLTIDRMGLFLASTVALLVASAPANAMIIGVTPTGGSAGDNVISSNCTGGANGPALTITGCLNQNHTALMDFKSNENIQFDAGGQAVVRGSDGALQTLTLDPVNFVLNELIVNIDASADGWVKFCDNDGCWATVLTVDGSGSNFFDITFNPNGDFLTFTTYSNSGGTTVAQLIANSKQWRVEVTPTPEPFTLSLFGAGIAGAFALRRRKKA